LLHYHNSGIRNLRRSNSAEGSYARELRTSSKSNIAEALSDNCNIIEFLNDEKVVAMGEEYRVTGITSMQPICAGAEKMP